LRKRCVLTVKTGPQERAESDFFVHAIVGSFVVLVLLKTV
jgi:uncharacterized membrane protein YeaQ/YmgE (transglycosylase-associated protein family)